MIKILSIVALVVATAALGACAKKETHTAAHTTATTGYSK